MVVSFSVVDFTEDFDAATVSDAVPAVAATAAASVGGDGSVAVVDNDDRVMPVVT